jgi:hypothetical protein
MYLDIERGYSLGYIPPVGHGSEGVSGSRLGAVTGQPLAGSEIYTPIYILGLYPDTLTTVPVDCIVDVGERFGFRGGRALLMYRCRSPAWKGDAS